MTCHQLARGKSLPLPCIGRDKWDNPNTQRAQMAGSWKPVPFLRSDFSLSWTEPPQAFYSPVSRHVSSGYRVNSPVCTDEAPSSSQYVLFLFRIYTDFLKGRFPETTTRSDLLETLAQIAFLWEGHSPLMAFYLHLSQRSAPQGLGSIHFYFYVLSTNRKAQHPSDTK